MIFNVDIVRADFPILELNVHGYPLAYLDNAATTQKPSQVIKCLSNYYEYQNANIHRGTYYLTEFATELFEEARKSVQQFINAKHQHECIFTRGTTEGINLVANGFTRAVLKPGDEIIISQTEHHANIVPWQMACEYSGASLKIIPCNDAGELEIDKYIELLNPKTKIVAIAHICNALGAINPIKEMITLAHQNGTPVLIDGAQAIAHQHIDVQDLDCDFYCFSGHKMYGPTGIGVIYGKTDWLERLPPYQGGGEMIQTVTFEKTIYNHLPYKFEAGTMPIAQAIGLQSAIEYLQKIGTANILQHESILLRYALEKMKDETSIHFIGYPKERAPIISFLLADIHPHDVGTILDHKGIAVRTGQHCAQPTMDRFGVNATIRASFGIYNTIYEIDSLIDGLRDAVKLFKG